LIKRPIKAASIINAIGIRISQWDIYSIPSYSAHDMPKDFKFSLFKGNTLPSGHSSWLKAITVISSGFSKSPNTAITESFSISYEKANVSISRPV